MHPALVPGKVYINKQQFATILGVSVRAIDTYIERGGHIPARANAGPDGKVQSPHPVWDLDDVTAYITKSQEAKAAGTWKPGSSRLVNATFDLDRISLVLPKPTPVKERRVPAAPAQQEAPTPAAPPAWMATLDAIAGLLPHVQALQGQAVLDGNAEAMQVTASALDGLHKLAMYVRNAAQPPLVLPS